MEIVNEPNSMIIKHTFKYFLNRYKKKRRIFLLEELSKAGFTKESPEIKKDEFIAAFIATEDALKRSSSKNKIMTLSNMLVYGVESGKLFENPSSYHEILSIVDDLSDREIIILYYLYDYSNNNKSSCIKTEPKNMATYIAGKMNCDVELSSALLTRLERTGLLSIAHGFSGAKSHELSALARDLKEWVEFQIDQGHI
ncbi:hypothetical protein [Halomonas sp. HL-93]|uniref:hypothetical protein n=1 Tax=Halomonas sp. HL-93 TaxID=1666906 RepID=UPI0007F0C493|nr:hypothetical protein [Halomonas sp. HL-93]SBR49155.1 hypothetical protein GA0071314_2068 [Halomonas sp. HL-93]